MQEKTFSDLIAGLTTGFTPVVDAGFFVEDYVPIDLSVNNPELQEAELTSASEYSIFLRKFLEEKQKKVAFGGYNEKRGLYKRSALFSTPVEEDLIRNVHLGVDIWAEEGTAVLAVLDGTVHSFQDNNNFGDYGPTIILKHEFQDLSFYSLYGHLSRNSLAHFKAGQQVKAGEKIGELGGPSENGDYAPHLHFQIIRDLGTQKGDFPGVACKRDLEKFLSNCPDPNLLLKIPS
ncbi:peptidoglycan DD-metalloendopeptidase family protein [Salinimicrobium soli]|uniref:peptidoglycan DD-metalloendopeptidase family protein n=1 Tax=Salinimicrobium soli TaxID=1254399 RepID=UPI003AAC095A